MPIYEYACEACHEKFDHLVRSMSGSNTDAVKCPKCDSPKTTRALSLVAVGGSSESASPASASGLGGCCPCGKTPGSCSR